MRPRSAGTFLISRPETSANESARSRMRSIAVAVEVVDGEQVPHASRLLRGWRDRDLVDAVELLDADVDALRPRGREVLADVVGADRQLAVAAVGEHGELDARGPAVVEERLDRRAHGAAGVEDVVDDRRPCAAVEREVEVRGVDDRRARARVARSSR